MLHVHEWGPADAPPVYHWTGVNKPPDRSPAPDADEGSASVAGTSLFRRLGLSFRRTARGRDQLHLERLGHRRRDLIL